MKNAVDYIPESIESEKPKKLPRILKMGRPMLYPITNPIWKQIAEGISCGKSLTSVLKAEGMPSYSMARLMISTSEEFRAMYDKAVEDRADRLAEEIIELSDAEMPEGLRGPEASAWVQQKRLQVDARKWVASKLKPRTYGDKIDVSVTDARISVIDAITEAQSRVTFDKASVTDVTPKDPE
jgi:hypothetical protein